MSGSIKIEQDLKGSSKRLRLLGPIDENSDFSVISTKGIKEFQIDFEGVSLVNSSGIQKWVRFLQTVPPDAKIIAERCPRVVVNQINLFPAFLTDHKNTEIRSFFAPYFCAKCDKLYDVLLEVEEYFPDRQKLATPKAHCEKDGDEMSFDGLEKKYFLFLKRK